MYGIVTNARSATREKILIDSLSVLRGLLFMMRHMATLDMSLTIDRLVNSPDTVK